MMEQEKVYKELENITENIYVSLVKNQKNMMIKDLSNKYLEEKNKFKELANSIEKYERGEVLNDILKDIKRIVSELDYASKDDESKYRVYLRGLGKAGKSTLLNALLSLDEKKGSKMGILPTTFIVDVYTDEVDKDKAEVLIIDKNGQSKVEKMSREKAEKYKEKEELLEKQSKEKCQKLIDVETRNVYLEDEKEEIIQRIKKDNLKRTNVEEIKWGIEKNSFFQNCILIDTPGLDHERIKEYKINGIIWTIRSDRLSREENANEIKREFEALKSVYSDNKVIAVVNMFAKEDMFDVDEYIVGSRQWERIRKKANKIYCDGLGFNEVICVNARMAYEGNEENDKKKINNSNILQLRKRINELFIEKNNDEYMDEKFRAASTYQKMSYKEVGDYIYEIERFTRKYNDIKAKISNLENSCYMSFKRELDDLKNRQNVLIKSNIQVYATAINGLDSKGYSEQERFIKDKIIETDSLNRKLQNVINKNEKLIYERFKEQQFKSIVSIYKTEKYKMESFPKHLEITTSLSNISSVSIVTDYDDWGGIFSETGFVGDVARLFRSIFGASTTQRWTRRALAALDKYFEQIKIDDYIRDYVERCYQTLDSSMKYSCGEYNDVSEIVEQLNEFVDKKKIIKKYEPDLFEIIGG